MEIQIELHMYIYVYVQKKNCAGHSLHGRAAGVFTSGNPLTRMWLGSHWRMFYRAKLPEGLHYFWVSFDKIPDCCQKFFCSFLDFTERICGALRFVWMNKKCFVTVFTSDLVVIRGRRKVQYSPPVCSIQFQHVPSTVHVGIRARLLPLVWWWWFRVRSRLGRWVCSRFGLGLFVVLALCLTLFPLVSLLPIEKECSGGSCSKYLFTMLRVTY